MRVPGTKWMPTGNLDNDPPIIPIGFILHVDAMNSSSLFNYFNGPSNGIESTLFIPKLGITEQYRDTHREADANLKANSFWKDGKRYGFLSIETQGYGKGEWTPEQLAEIKRILLWGRDVLKIPLRRCPGPFAGGIGFHTMWGAPSEWTPVAKSCPGYDRIKQFDEILVPWMAAQSVPKPVVDLSRLARAALRGDSSYITGTRVVQKALKAEGLLTGIYVIGRFGGKTRRAYKAWQVQLGYTGAGADGIPGKGSLTKLARRRGFTVVA